MFAHIFQNLIQKFAPAPAINCNFALVLKDNPYHGDGGLFTSKNKAVQPGHKKTPTVQAIQQALDKVGAAAFEQAVNDHHSTLPKDANAKILADGIERVARQILAKKIEEKAAPLYVQRKLMNPDPFIAWAKEQGFLKVLAPEELHVTIAYSKEPVLWAAAGDSVDKLQNSEGKRSVSALGDGGAVVLKFTSQELQTRWKEFKDAGASWDYEGYTPHITISYNGEGINLATITPYTGVLELGPEIYEPLDEDYKETVVEKAETLLPIAGFALVLKANPYHDSKDGKFTTHANAGFVSLWGKKGANIKDPANQSKVVSAYEHQLEKSKEYAFILGSNVRNGSQDVVGQKINQALADQAKFHAQAASMYGKHATPDQSFREMFADKALQSLNASNLAVSEKQKLKLPLTSTERGAVEYVKELQLADVVAANEKKTLASNKAKVKTAVANLDKNFVDISHKAMLATQKGQHYKANQEMAKVVKLQAKMLKDGMTQEQLDHQMAKNDAQFENYKSGIKNMLSLKYAETLDLQHKAKNDPSLQSRIDTAKDATNAMYKEHKYMIDGFQLSEIQYNGKAQLADKHDALKQAHMDNMNTWVNSSTANKEAAAFAEKNKSGEALKKAGFSTAEISAVNNAAANKEVAKTTHGTEPVNAYDAYLAANVEAASLKDKNKAAGIKLPDIAKANLPDSKEEALALSKAMGKQYYDLKAAGTPAAELGAAHALYDQAKDHYVAKGGKKDEFSSISNDLKQKATNDYQKAKDSITAEQKKEAQVVQTMKNSVIEAKSKWEMAVMAGRDTTELSTLKEKHIKALDAALASGKLNNSDVSGLDAGGQKLGKLKYEEKADEYLTGVKASAEASAKAYLTKSPSGGKDGLAADADLKAYLTIAKNHGISTDTIQAAHDKGTESGKKIVEAQKAMLEAFGDPHKSAKLYDDSADTFLNVKDNKGWAAKMKEHAETLPSATKTILKNYTNATYKTMNKEVGKYGTDKMNGKDIPDLTDYMKKQVKDMDRAFADLPLGENVKLRRNFPQKYLIEQLGLNLANVNAMSNADLAKHFVGKVYKETAFSSTSMDQNFTSVYSSEADATGKASMHIRANKETKGINVMSISTHGSEHEVILARGTTYVIRSVTRGSGNDGKLKIHADVIGTFPDKV